MHDLVLEQLRSALTGQYVPDRVIGHGGMASVYLAMDLKHGRPVAIKVLRLAVADRSAIARFLREIKILAQLSHPHIVPLFDSGVANGLPYYVTPYIEGETLRAMLRASPHNQLRLEDAIRFVQEIADALDFAHGANVLHRDVKPENILLHDDHALVVDFGIARAIQAIGEAVITDTGVAVGTPAYMSPEQLAATGNLDARSDIYALACVFYETLAGVQPFMGVRGVVDNSKKFDGPPTPLRDLRGDVPASVDLATRRALSSNPDERFATAGEFVAALD